MTIDSLNRGKDILDRIAGVRYELSAYNTRMWAHLSDGARIRILAIITQDFETQVNALE